MLWYTNIIIRQAPGSACARAHTHTHKQTCCHSSFLLWIRCRVSEQADGCPGGSEPCHSPLAFLQRPRQDLGGAADEMGGFCEFPAGVKPSSPCGLTNSLLPLSGYVRPRLSPGVCFLCLSSQGLSFPFLIPMRHLSNAEYERQDQALLMCREFSLN